ncbi:MAG: hypothetical protein Q8R55_06810 [Candidatus Taylorbacteria bacterium]|nr:hypothetical protein [Candidatus Taylorbacteria bacterium]
MRLFLVTFFAFIFVGLTLFGMEKLYHLQSEVDFVILTDKVGDPALMTIFRVAPDKNKEKDPNYCSVGGDKLYTPWNVSVFTSSKAGDVLKRYHYTDHYRIFGKTFLKDCYDRFMPVKTVSLYPDMNYWPFRKDDLKPGDPDYDHIVKLTKSQR